MAQKMHNAGLHLGLREHRVMASGKPFSPSTTAIRMSLDPAGAQLVHYPQSELGALGLHGI